ncbi:MAG: hypothetical protein ACE5F5_10400 [Acidimicrobiia bacterium]
MTLAATSWARVRTGSRAATGSLSPAVTSLTLAAAAFGTVELVFARVLAPILANLDVPVGLATWVAWVAKASITITTAMVVAAALAFAATLAGARRAALLGVTVAVGVAGIGGGVASSLALHLMAVVAIGTVVTAATPMGSRSAGVLLVGVGLALSQASLAIPAAEVGLRLGAEAALVAGVLALATSVLTSGAIRPRHGLAAAAAAALAAGSLVFAPNYIALAGFSALGAMLWMPPVIYIVAAGAAGLLFAFWLSLPAQRRRAAGLALLAVAGLHPMLVHHSLTAVLALTALASEEATNEEGGSGP